MSVDNTSKLIERITQDAEAEAQRVIAEAEAKAADIRQAASEQVKEIQAESEAFAEKKENEILMLARTNAALEAKKNDLMLRRKLLEEAYSKALERLYSLSGTDLEKFFARSIVKEANGGEVVMPSKAHRESISRVIRPVNIKLDEQGKAPVTLGEDCELKSGYMLAGEGYIVECSFEDIIDELKERETANIADKLFS
jgi:vacuolar-type H+-ATPase subunit E/Vma4